MRLRWLLPGLLLEGIRLRGGHRAVREDYGYGKKSGDQADAHRWGSCWWMTMPHGIPNWFLHWCRRQNGTYRLTVFHPALTTFAEQDDKLGTQLFNEVNMRVSGFLLALMITAGVSTAAAQTTPTFGVKGGVNFANMDFDSDDVNVSFDRRIGLVAGGFVLWPVQDAFSLQVEGLFSQKGATVEEAGAEGSIKLDFFEVPVLARFSAPSSTATSFHVFAGPSFGFKLRARSESEFDGESDSMDISDDVAGFDLGLVVGAGAEFGRVVVDGRYTHGLTNLNKAEDEDNVKIRNRAFSVMAGIRF